MLVSTRRGLGWPLAVSFLACALAPAALADEGEWTRIATNGPPERRGAWAVFDEAGGRFVMFGGQDGQRIYGDTYAFDVRTERWSRIPGRQPSRRCHHTAVVDTRRDRMIVWGGFSFEGRRDDLWSFDLRTDTWTQHRQRGVVPEARCLQSAVYDEARDRLVLFGGTTGSGQRRSELFGGTWELDLGTYTWRRLSAPSPSARYGQMAWVDADAERMLVFGGFDARRVLDETWAFDLRTDTWSRLDVGAARPSPREDAALAVRPGRRDAVLFGGGHASSDPARDLWRFDMDADRWERIDQTGQRPRARWRMTAAYDPAAGALYVFGGGTREGPQFGDSYRLDLSASGGAPVSDDRFEENDEPDRAAALDAGRHEGLVLRDQDWYRVRVGAGGRLRVEIAFDHDRGDLDLAVGTADLELVERSDSADDAEVVDVSGLAPGDYVVLVYGYRGATNAYDLLLAESPGGSPPAPAALDVDFMASAYETPAGQQTEVTFQAEVSGGTPPYRYAWDFDGGLGSGASGPTARHTFPGARPYDVTLAVTDAAGRTASATHTIGVAAPAPAPAPSGVADFDWRPFANQLTRSACDDPTRPVAAPRRESIQVIKVDDVLGISDGQNVIVGVLDREEAGRLVYRLVSDDARFFRARGEATLYREGGALRLEAALSHLDAAGRCRSGWIFDATER